MSVALIGDVRIKLRRSSFQVFIRAKVRLYTITELSTTVHINLNSGTRYSKIFLSAAAVCKNNPTFLGSNMRYYTYDTIISFGLAYRN